MKIGIDARMYGAQNTTGIGLYIKQLIDNLLKIDKENQYVIFLKPKEYYQTKFSADNVKKVLVKAPWYSFSEQLIFPFQIYKEKLDLMHFPHFNSPILYFKKSVCTIHDITPFYFKGHKMKSSFRRYSQRLVFNLTTKKAKRIFTVSNTTKEALINECQIAKNKIIVSHLGVDNSFKIIDNYGIINSVKEKYGLTKPFIFYVGAWRNHKNLESLVSAFNLLKEKEQIPHTLVIAGQEDPAYPNVRLTVNNSPFKNQIILPGFIDDEDLPILYNLAELFVFPSFNEGFGLMNLEAQACACPLAVSDIKCFHETLNDSSLYFDPHNISDIAEKILQIIKDPILKQNLISKGKENIKKYSWANCAQITYDNYLKVCHEKKESNNP